ncbi:MAG: hypothetical protein ABJH05_11095 [Fulvivirga sp.]
MERPRIISRKPLNKYDILILAAHLLAVLTIWISYKHRLVPPESLKDFISGYFFILPIVLVGLFFRNLRNINFYGIWVMIAFFQPLIYPELHDLSGFQFYRGSAFTPLRSLLPTLLVYQLFRIIFIKTHNMEMIISIRQFRMSMWEEEEKRNMTWLEVLFSITIALTAVLSNVYI